MFKQTKVDAKVIDKIILYYTPFSKKIPSPTMLFFARNADTTVTIYTNHTVTIQGNHAQSEAARFFSNASSEKKQKQLFENVNYPVIGSDESGAGDVFGPLVVSAVFIETQEQYDKLKALGITDSKKMSDQQNTFLSFQIQKLCQTQTVIFNNPRYNQLIQNGINLNALKTAGHLQTTKTLYTNATTTPLRLTVDQFTTENSFWKYVTTNLRKEIPPFQKKYLFQTKAESDFLEVAAASVIARATFLRELSELSKMVGEPLLKGAGNAVDIQIRKLHKKKVNFDKIAKTHFSNIKKQAID